MNPSIYEVSVWHTFLNNQAIYRVVQQGQDLNLIFNKKNSNALKIQSPFERNLIQHSKFTCKNYARPVSLTQWNQILHNAKKIASMCIFLHQSNAEHLCGFPEQEAGGFHLWWPPRKWAIAFSMLKTQNVWISLSLVESLQPANKSSNVAIEFIQALHKPVKLAIHPFYHVQLPSPGLFHSHPCSFHSLHVLSQ